MAAKRQDAYQEHNMAESHLETACSSGMGRLNDLKSCFGVEARFRGGSLVQG